MTGGTLTALAAYDSSTMNISGGVVSAQINVNDNATLNITGGNEESTAISANDSGTINFSNGSAGSLNASGGTVNMTGGTVDCTGLKFRHNQPLGRQHHRPGKYADSLWCWDAQRLRIGAEFLP